jgi:tRNA U34 2-thiouridine synthase MnmA/TrmU
MSGGVGFSHLEKASKVASLPGVPHTVIDFRLPLREKVVAYFVGLLLEKTGMIT